MMAKELMERAMRFNVPERSLKVSLEELRDRSQSITVSYGGLAVQHSRNVHALEDIMIKMAEVEERLKSVQAQKAAALEEVRAVIDQLDNERYKEVLFKRYVLMMRPSEICLEMGYCSSYERRLHCEALDAVQKILDENAKE